MSSVAVCAICFEDARPIFEDLQSISACGHVFHASCLQQWMEHCPAGRDPTCPSCKRSILFVYEQFKKLESQVAVNLQKIAVDLQWAETAEAATVVASSELARLRQDLTSFQEELMHYSLELEKVGKEIRAMEKVLPSKTRWDRFFRVIRVLREDRENWPWNLLKAYLRNLVELAEMGHNVWTS